MHEFSIATRILDSLLDYCETHHASGVSTVKVELGELMGADPDQLKFSYDSIKQMTPLQTSSLAIETVHAEIRCPHCGYTGHPHRWSEQSAGLQCPKCGHVAETIKGAECVIKSFDPAEPDMLAMDSAGEERDVFHDSVRSEL